MIQQSHDSRYPSSEISDHHRQLLPKTTQNPTITSAPTSRDVVFCLGSYWPYGPLSNATVSDVVVVDCLGRMEKGKTMQTKEKRKTSSSVCPPTEDGASGTPMIFIPVVSLLSSFVALLLIRSLFILSYYSRNAGGFPARMAVQKNKFVEEWNGQREITEKTFKIDFADVPTFVMTILVFPYTVYTWTRSEFKNKGDRRYQNIF